MIEIKTFTYDNSLNEEATILKIDEMLNNNEVSLDDLNDYLTKTNEGVFGSLLGGLTGFALGKSIGKTIAKVLGIEKGVLYDLLTSRLVGAAFGSALGKKI